MDCLMVHLMSQKWFWEVVALRRATQKMYVLIADGEGLYRILNKRMLGNKDMSLVGLIHDDDFRPNCEWLD
jgi:hypothetical protein